MSPLPPGEMRPLPSSTGFPLPRAFPVFEVTFCARMPRSRNPRLRDDLSSVFSPMDPLSAHRICFQRISYRGGLTPIFWFVCFPHLRQYTSDIDWFERTRPVLTGTRFSFWKIRFSPPILVESSWPVSLFLPQCLLCFLPPLLDSPFKALELPLVDSPDFGPLRFPGVFLFPPHVSMDG